MEQKNIDEIDESFFGEQIVDEGSSKNIKKTTKAKTTKRRTAKKKEEETSIEVEEAKAEILKNIKEDSITVVPADAHDQKKEHKVEIKKEETKVGITSKPTDPWDEEETEASSGIFSSISTWRAISVVLVILLLFMAFGGGSTGAAVADGSTITLKQAEAKGLEYVNTELLEAPFLAELTDSEDVGSLYRLQFSVAGQSVDSYLTKDGKLFFPQGFPVDEELPGSDNVEETFDAGNPNAVSTEGDAFLGNEDAPITIVEFSDFQCPFCARATEIVDQLKETYVQNGDVKLVYKDFPLTSIHPEALPAALAAECANEQGKFWEYHDILFDRQAELGTESYLTWAEELGLDLDQFSQCLESEKYLDEVDADSLEGAALGVAGTPAFFVNGKLIEGAQPFEVFQNEIEGILAAIENANGDEVPSEVVETPVVEEVANSNTVSVELSAKRWLFSPRTVTVSEGDTVELTVVPDGLAFTFAIPAFGVEQEVTSPTTVSFTADRAGSFDITCASCEAWRGMSGTLIVE